VNKKPVIVLVEDEPMELLQLTQTLQQSSEYEIHQALNAHQAFEICERVAPDIIISDYKMPGDTGFDLCQKIKKHPVLRRAFFILLTGMQEVDKIVEGLNIGADDYLTKPYHPEELRSRVNAFLRIKKLQDTIDDDNIQLEKLNTDLEDSFRGVVSLLCDLMELRVPNASIRSHRAEEIMGWISQKLSLPENQIEALHYAARLHEIGKISMPDTLIKKSYGELTEEERSEMANYPIRGQLLMRDIPVLKPVAFILRHQLENYDGTGYPDRLHRDEIPVGSRILRVITDIETAYQKQSVSIQQIEEYLLAKKGIFYDPQILLLALDYLHSKDHDFVTENVLQITVTDLQPGMALSRDLYTSSGKKLLAKNTPLTEKTIVNIQAHHQNDPILVGVYVFKSTGTT
jgi:response regulator RpfG family c-di-GMP phosphodiesterase